MTRPALKRRKIGDQEEEEEANEAKQDDVEEEDEDLDDYEDDGNGHEDSEDEEFFGAFARSRDPRSAPTGNAKEKKINHEENDDKEKSLFMAVKDAASTSKMKWSNEGNSLFIGHIARIGASGYRTSSSGLNARGWKALLSAVNGDATLLNMIGVKGSVAKQGLRNLQAHWTQLKRVYRACQKMTSLSGNPFTFDWESGVMFGSEEQWATALDAWPHVYHEFKSKRHPYLSAIADFVGDAHMTGKHAIAKSYRGSATEPLTDKALPLPPQSVAKSAADTAKAEAKETNKPPGIPASGPKQPRSRTARSDQIMSLMAKTLETVSNNAAPTATSPVQLATQHIRALRDLANPPTLTIEFIHWLQNDPASAHRSFLASRMIARGFWTI